MDLGNYNPLSVIVYKDVCKNVATTILMRHRARARVLSEYVSGRWPGKSIAYDAIDYDHYTLSSANLSDDEIQEVQRYLFQVEKDIEDPFSTVKNDK
jgi:hypothetical protein